MSDSPTPSATADTKADAAEPIYCANHPGVETLLRCNRCGKPICLKCAVLTDVGYRCKECIRGVQASYFNAEPADNAIAFAIAAVVAGLAAPLASILLGMFFFWGIIRAFMVGSAAGGVLAQIIRAAVSRRRGRYLRHATIGGVVVGVLAWAIIGLFFGISVFNIPMLVFTVLASAAAYQILR